MAPGGPAGRGRGAKYKKFTRGGGKHFSRDLRPLDDNGNEIREKNANDSSSEEEDSNEEEEKDSEEDSEEESEDSEEDSEEESEESSEEEEEEKPEMTREQRRAAAKAKKEAAIKKKNEKVVEVGDLPTDSEEESEDDDMPANPNHSKAARNQAKAPPMSVDEVAGDVAKMSVSKRPQELSRKEREAIEAYKKKKAYEGLRSAGETEEARADLERLAKIREERRVAAERKAAEEEERKGQEQAKSEQLARAARREAAMGPATRGKKGKK